MIQSRHGAAVRDLTTLFETGSFAGISDAELLTRFVDRLGEPSESAFAALVDRHGPTVLRVCRDILFDEHAAWDAFQASFLVLARRSSSLNVHGTLGPWLYEVAYRTAAGLRGSRLRRLRHETIAAGLGTDVVRETQLDDSAAAIHEEIARLPRRQCAVVVLHYLEGRTHEETASVLGWPIGTVKSHLARARERLRERLNRRGLAPALVVPFARPALPTASRAALLHAVASVPLAATASKTLGLLTVRSAAVFLATVAVLASGAWASREDSRSVRLVAVRRPIRQDKPAETPPAERSGIPGEVVDGEGKPVAGALVVAGYGKFDPMHAGDVRILRIEKARTDNQGRFVMTPPIRSADRGSFVAYREGLAPAAAFLQGPDLWFAGQVPGQTIRLVLRRPEPYFGEVVDEKGAPVEGATVRAVRLIDPVDGGKRLPIVTEAVDFVPELKPLLVVTSNAQGRFEFPAAPAPGSLQVRATAPGKAYADTGFAAPSAPDQPMKLVLTPSARIEGRIDIRFGNRGLTSHTTALGFVIEVVETESSIRQRGRMLDSATRRTDQTGAFIVDGLHGGSTFSLVPKLREGGPPLPYDPVSVTTEPGRVVSPRIRLTQGVRLSGRVLLRTGNIPAGKVSVRFTPEDAQGAVYWVVASDDMGRYEVTVPPIRGRIQAFAFGTQSNEFTGEIRIDASRDAREGELSVPDLLLRRTPVENLPRGG